MDLDKMTNHRNMFFRISFPFPIICKNYPALMMFISCWAISTILS